MRRTLVLSALCIVLAAGSACAGDDLARGQARLDVHDGSSVSLSGDAGFLRLSAGSRMVGRGSEVAVDSGGATLTMARGASLELRDRSRVVVDRRPELRAGETLIISGTRPVTVRSAGTSVSVSGAARLSRSLAVAVSAYDGSVLVTSAGRSLAVPSLRQATVPALGLVPARPEPLTYDVSDLWDRRFLGLAMDLTDALQAYSDGFTAVPMDIQPGADQYRELLPVLGAERFSERLLGERRPAGEKLVGAAVAAAGNGSTFDRRWASLFGFRDAGAAWGLVVLDQAVPEPAKVIHLLGEATRRALSQGGHQSPVLSPEGSAQTGPTAAGSPATGSAAALLAASPAASPAQPGPPSPVTISTPNPTGTSPVPPATSPTPPPTTTPPPPPGTPLDPVAQAVVGLVDDAAGKAPRLLP